MQSVGLYRFIRRPPAALIVCALIVGVLAVGALAALAGCSTAGQNGAGAGADAGTGAGTGAGADAGATASEEAPQVKITMEDGGVILLELDPQAAPQTVENFLKLVNEGFYDGLTFHRIIPGFMIQGGDPEGDGTGGADQTVIGEFASNGVNNPISHTRGVISMARSQNPDSASSQFFITNADALNLDGDYAAFGRVLEGMDVVDRISAVETDARDKPLTPVVIKSIEVVQER
jgi:peptidyl-prolyl cis-trans isomerase B (cyclophilin B)